MRYSIAHALFSTTAMTLTAYPRQLPSTDATALSALVCALVHRMGRGGLTRMATWLGMSPANLSKRLQSNAGAFDPITMRAVLLVQRLKDPSPNGTKPTGNYRVRLLDGQPRWAAVEKENLSTTAKIRK